MTIDDLHSRLAGPFLGQSPNEQDAMALMILFHTHRFRLSAPLDPLRADRPGVSEVNAITQRDAAAAIAAAWPDRADKDRCDYRFWYWRYNTVTPYETVEEIPPDWLERVQKLKETLLANSSLAEAVPED